MKNALLIALSILFTSEIISQKTTVTLPKSKLSQKSTSHFTYKVVSTRNNTFGYDIYNNSKLLIHQPIIPALPGNENGFQTKADAIKVAWLAITKLKRGEVPPSISIEEMKILKVIK